MSHLSVPYFLGPWHPEASVTFLSGHSFAHLAIACSELLGSGVPSSGPAGSHADSHGTVLISEWSSTWLEPNQMQSTSELSPGSWVRNKQTPNLQGTQSASPGFGFFLYKTGPPGEITSQIIAFICCLQMEILPDLPRNKHKMIPSVTPARAPEPRSRGRQNSCVRGVHCLEQ